MNKWRDDISKPRPQQRNRMLVLSSVLFKNVKIFRKETNSSDRVQRFLKESYIKMSIIRSDVVQNCASKVRYNVRYLIILYNFKLLKFI